ncbi:MAG TPA: gluconate 2-dehydrogenase subunit 3 family protein [Blastocatellia bacterium]|nr:gluconate 2-dehydrogenase subunit 3 family protein [Blastocatellia bacterium]
MSTSVNSVEVAFRDEVYILNHCTKYLARTNRDQRHNHGQFAGDDPRGEICESWRFPIVDSHYDASDREKSYGLNEVTFVYRVEGGAAPQEVSVTGTFANLYEGLPLRRLRYADEDTDYYAVTLLIPKGEVHTYQFLIDGRPLLDPINPQRVRLENGAQWSRFFTHYCSVPLSFERHELAILKRLTDHILPFQTEEGERFLRFFYNGLDNQSKETQLMFAWRLDQEVGAVNFIDKLLAREENHHLTDYKLCLALIDRVLRQRNPFIEPGLLSKEYYINLYNEMAGDQVNGWDYGRYQSPRYFLQLLRRHTLTGAFSHPKYGGNVGAAGWAYLAERYTDKGINQGGQTLFNWRQAIEEPLGTNQEYRG